MLRTLRHSAPAVAATLFCALASQLSIGQSTGAGLTGNWAGALDTVHSDGSVEPDAAYFTLTQAGETVTGVAGNSPDHLSPFSGGKLTGDTLSFDIVVNPQMTVKFRLTREADRLHGTATGIPAEDGSTVVVDVQRADADWHSASPVAHVKDRLFDTVVGLDQKLFDAYNKCDLPTLGGMVTDDLEFYHDKTGLSVGRQVFVDAIRDNICGKTQRVLVPGTLQVYRLDHYGAVEMGVHRFIHPGHEEIGVGEAKFITVWQLKNGEWKISREISYDHEAAAK